MLRRMRRFLPAIVLVLALSPIGGAWAASPKTAIFFYPWYSNLRHDGHYTHWTQGGHTPPFDIASAFYPARGPYSSDDPRVLNGQMRDIAQSGVDEVVSSWWGRGSFEDRLLPAVMRAAKQRGLQVAVQLEPYPGRTVDSVGADLVYIRSLGIRDVYIYRSNDFTAEDWSRVTSQPLGLRLFGQTNLVRFAARAGFAGFYTYDIVIYDGSKFDRYCRQARSLGDPLRSLRRSRLRRHGRHRRHARQGPSVRRDVRLNVERGAARRRRLGHDHLVQRVGRGNADRTGGPRGEVRELRRRIRLARPSRAARVPHAHRLLDLTLLRRRLQRSPRRERRTRRRRRGGTDARDRRRRRPTFRYRVHPLLRRRRSRAASRSR